MPASSTPAASTPSTADSTVSDAPLQPKSPKRRSGSPRFRGPSRREPSTNASTNANRRSGIERARGEALFAKEWVPNDPMSHGGDGLGPVYNDTSCVACHGLGAPGGAGPENKNVVLVTAVPNNCGPLQSLDKIHPGFRGSRSAVLHLSGTDSEYGSWRRHFVDPNHNPDQTPAPNQGEDAIQKRIRTIKEQIVPDHRLAGRSGQPTIGERFQPQSRRAQHPRLVRSGPNRRDPVGGAGRCGARVSPPRSGAGSAAQKKDGSAVSAGKPSSRACMNLSVSRAPTSLAWRCPGIRRRSRR